MDAGALQSEWLTWGFRALMTVFVTGLAAVIRWFATDLRITRDQARKQLSEALETTTDAISSNARTTELKLDALEAAVAKQNGRVGRLETWTEFYQREQAELQRMLRENLSQLSTSHETTRKSIHDLRNEINLDNLKQARRDLEDERNRLRRERHTRGEDEAG